MGILFGAKFIYGYLISSVLTTIYVIFSSIITGNALTNAKTFA